MTRLSAVGGSGRVKPSCWLEGVVGWTRNAAAGCCAIATDAPRPAPSSTIWRLSHQRSRPALRGPARRAPARAPRRRRHSAQTVAAATRITPPVFAIASAPYCVVRSCDGAIMLAPNASPESATATPQTTVIPMTRPIADSSPAPDSLPALAPGAPADPGPDARRRSRSHAATVAPNQTATATTCSTIAVVSTSWPRPSPALPTTTGGTSARPARSPTPTTPATVSTERTATATTVHTSAATNQPRDGSVWVMTAARCPLSASREMGCPTVFAALIGVSSTAHTAQIGAARRARDTAAYPSTVMCPRRVGAVHSAANASAPTVTAPARSAPMRSAAVARAVGQCG